MFVLDLPNMSQGPVSEIVNKWSLVTVKENPNVPQNEYRYASQFIAFPNGSLLFNGGYNEDNPLVARNVTYNPQENTWSVVIADGYRDSRNGYLYRQM